MKNKQGSRRRQPPALPSSDGVGDRTRRTAAEILALLQDDQFRDAAYCLHRQVAALRGSGRSEFTEAAQSAVIELGNAFKEEWGVLPPPAPDLVNPDPRRPTVYMIASGRWGLVPVFPWTTDGEIREQVRAIRRTIKKQHQDAMNAHRIRLVDYLSANGCSRADAARAVFARKTGLRRPTAAEATRKIPESQETALLEHLMAGGRSYREAEKIVARRARGSEPRAVAAIRVAERRYERDRDRLNAELERPMVSEPLSHALTNLFRALPDGEDIRIRELALTARKSFLESGPR